ncbi:hypothetical protein ACTQ49_07845 [Luteococcus sp. Sow4_B9]|uniref:hypothetical protein n=1 Tax=Luteococcus sp. Sow4_B9 TaxID=3438792 RepID=UPI003F9E1A60
MTSIRNQRSTVLAALAIIATTGLVGCGSSAASPTPSETEASVSQARETQAPVTQAPETEAPETQAPVTQAPVSSAPAASSAAPVTLDATIGKPSDAATQLADTTAEFQEYMSKRVQELGADCTQQVSVTVDRFWQTGLATGSVGGCDNAQALWFQDEASGQWKEYGYQSVDPCSEIEAKGVPASASVTGLVCTDEGSTTPVPYPGTAA